MPFARILVFALALTHAVGLADLVMDDACDEVCTNDGCGADCLPGVPCRCHSPSAMPQIAGAAQSAASVGALSVASFHPDQRLYASPDPREILHVPRLVV